MAKKQQYQLTDLLKTSGWVMVETGRFITLEKNGWRIAIGANSTTLYNCDNPSNLHIFQTHQLDLIIRKIKELKLWAV